MFFELPKLSDKGACEFCECLQEFVMAVESHYSNQIRRHIRKLEEGSVLPFEIITDSDDELPF